MFKEDSHPAYHCTYPSSLGGMQVYPTDDQVGPPRQFHTHMPTR